MSRRPAKRRRLLLVDSHALVRSCLRELIARSRDLAVCGEAESLEAALPLLAELRPDLVVADLSHPCPSSFDLLERVCAADPARPVLVLALQPEAVQAAHAFRVGAAGYAGKDGGGEEILGAIRRLLRGAVYAAPRLRGHVLRQFSREAAPHSRAAFADLTPTERLVFAASGARDADRDLAHVLRLNPSQLLGCRAMLRAKLHLANDAALRHHSQLWRAEHTPGAD